MIAAKQFNPMPPSQQLSALQQDNPPIVSRAATVHTVAYWQGFMAFAEGHPLEGMPTEEHAEGWWDAAQRVGASAPEAQDFATIETLAQLDEEEGVYLPPRHSTEAHDSYIIAWNTQWAKTEGRKLLR